MNVLVAGPFDWTLELEFRAMHLVRLTFFITLPCF
jgi:hypothetical protein